MNAYIPELLLHLCALGYTCTWVHDAKHLQAGELCFYLSYGKIVGAEMLSKFKHNLVVHESALPEGKGWSPLTWQILEGKNKIPVTLIEAEQKVDSGMIYAQTWLIFNGTELVDELRKAQAMATSKLCFDFIQNYPASLKLAKSQQGDESFYPRRTPKDSELDMNKTLSEQMNLLRVVDNESYPAFLTIENTKYLLKIFKTNE